MVEFTAPLRLRLDGEALVRNWMALAARSGAASCGAAVKANAYGLGAREVVPRLSGAGCTQFFVAHWGEAADIADLVPPDQIAVLNGMDADDGQGVRQLGAIPVLNTPSQIQRWNAGGGGRCHLMLDSGINRLGLGPDAVAAGVATGLDVGILLSHLASADEDAPQNSAQLSAFTAMAAAIPHQQLSLANSAGIMLGGDYHFDLTRPGLSLYGGIARPEMCAFIQSVVSIEALVLQVRDHDRGATIGYNATWKAEHRTRVATVACGYADGYYRGFSSKGGAFFNGNILPVIGRVSMDLTTLDASNAPDLQEGSWVQLDHNLAEAAKISGMSQYELLTGMGQRSQRIWA